MIKKIELYSVITGERRSFEASHAERLLRMGGRGGYALPEDSKFIFDARNGIRLRGDKKDSRKSAKKGSPE